MNTRQSKSSTIIVLAVAASAVYSASARAQVLAIDWFTIDGGGGMFANGGGFELSSTVGQPDASAPMTGGAFTLSGGFWPGASRSGRPCTGDETIAKAKCALRGGSNVLKVILKKGVAGDAFTITLSDGSSITGELNGRGKGKAKFTDRPPGDNDKAVTRWECGATAHKEYACP